MAGPGGVLAGLGAAASWGLGDFAGGLATRRANLWRVMLAAQAVGVVLVTLLVLAAREPMPPTRDLWWAVLAGVSGAIGIAGLYAALAAGQMGVAAPVTAVIGAILPVLVAAAIEGPPGALALAGIVLALPGITLLSRPHGKASPRALALAVTAGVGFGGFFVLIARASEHAFTWPLLAGRLSTLAVVTLAVLALARRRAPGEKMPWGLAAFAGAADTAGNGFFVLAASWGRLDVAAVLASLNPAFTVLLARALLKERLTRGQMVGFGLTLAAIVLISWA